MWIAVTGGVAEGKSTVCSLLGELGCSVLSADVVAREVLTWRETQYRVAEALKIREVNPEALREAISQDPVNRQKLNSVMHPLIWKIIQDSKSDVTEVPLLFEACLQNEFSMIWVVTCGLEEQKRRLVERGHAKAQIEQILAWQLPTRAKVALADEVIRTNEDALSVRNYVAEALAKERARI